MSQGQAVGHLERSVRFLWWNHGPVMDINRVIPGVISHSLTLGGKDLVNHDTFYNSLLHVVVCIFTTRIIQLELFQKGAHPSTNLLDVCVGLTFVVIKNSSGTKCLSL
jgi:hypothetical protein